MLTPARCAAFVFAASAAALVPRAAAAAEGKTSSLSWLRMPGADTCIATQPLARKVEERLGRAVFVSAAQADLSVEGRIEKRRGGGWRAVITMRDPQGALLGTRELERPDASCDAMSEPLALVIAVMIDPDAAMRPRETAPPAPEPALPAPPAPAPPPAAEPAPPPATTTTAETAPAPKPKKKEPWRAEGLGHLATVAGLAPQVAFGAGVSGILYPPGVPVGFRGTTTLFLPTFAEHAGARVAFDMLLFGGSVCPTIRGRVSVMGCLGGHLGVLRPRPEGTAAATLPDDAIPIWNVSAEVRASWHVLPPIAVTGGVGGAVPLVRPKYQDFYESSIVALTADVGLGFFFP